MSARRVQYTTRKSRSKGSGSGIAAIVLLVLLIAGAGGGFFWLYVQSMPNRIPRGADLCPLAGPAGQTIVLVDTTDTLPRLTQTEITTRLSDELLGLPKDFRIELRVLEPDDNRTRTVASLCNPGDGDDQNDWTGNPKKAKEKWQEQFAGPLAEAFRTSLQNTGADSSPILAALQAIAVERLTSNAARTIPSRIILISDMMEHTDDYSFYRDEVSFDGYLKSSAAIRYQTDLAGAEVTLWLIARLNAVPSMTLAEFWTEWALRNRGSFGSVIRLQG